MILYGFAFGLLVSLTLTPLIRFFARRRGILDAPGGERKTHGKPTPLLGGLAIFLALAAAVLAFKGSLLGGFLMPKHLTGILIGAAILVVGGYLDDRYDLKPRHQLVFTAAAAIAVIASGIGADVITNPFGGVWRLDLWHLTLFERGGVPYRLTLPADLFTFGWLMAMMYTTKLLDGLDGLVSGLVVIGATVMALYSLTPLVGQPELARLAMITAGAFGGFLFYNARPASIFLGEGGSTLAGFLLGVMAVMAGGKIGTTLMVLAVPFMDMVWTIIRRLFEGRPPAAGDAGHLHFRLVALGLTPGQTVTLFWLFAAAFGGVGLFLRGKEKLPALAILAILFIGVSALSRRRHKERHEPDGKH